MSLSFPTKTLSGHELSSVPCTGSSLTEGKKKGNHKTKEKRSLLPSSKNHWQLWDKIFLESYSGSPLSLETWVLNQFPNSGGLGYQLPVVSLLCTI